MSGLDLLAKLQLYEVLQTKVADRVLKMTWASKLDSSASIFEQSTSYKILNNTNFSQTDDYEAKYLRFWKRCCKSNARQGDNDMPHILNYRVWKESMLVRYALETFVYSVQVLALTYFISKFNQDLHLFEKDLHHL